MSLVTFGKFRLLKRLAIGGMGEIFLAKQDGPEGFEKILVVKRILEEHAFKPEYVDMFFAEAKLAAKMGHPNIAQIFEMGVIEDSYYISMEFVNGKSLADIVDTCRRTDQQIPPAHVAQILMQLCDGLGYAHALTDEMGDPLHIVHRDINLNNVLVTYRGEAKVIDFGIAKSAISERRTEDGTVKGQFAYMSPEQSAAMPIDQRSDIFSLGIVLYELLALKNPFHRTNIVQLLEAIKSHEPSQLASLNPELAPFDPIVRRALHKNPDQRYPDCAAMHADLQEALSNLEKPKHTLSESMRTMFADYILREKKVLQEARGKTPAASVIPMRAEQRVSSRRADDSERTREADISMMREQLRRSADPGFAFETSGQNAIDARQATNRGSAPTSLAGLAPPPPLPVPLLAKPNSASKPLPLTAPLAAESKHRARPQRMVAVAASLVVLIIGGSALAFIATRGAEPEVRKPAEPKVVAIGDPPVPIVVADEADDEEDSEEGAIEEVPVAGGGTRRVQLAPTHLRKHRRKADRASDAGADLVQVVEPTALVPVNNERVAEKWVPMNVQPIIRPAEPGRPAEAKPADKPGYERVSRAPTRISGEKDPPVPSSLLTQLRGSKGVVLVKIRISQSGSIDAVEMVRSTIPLLNEIVRNHIMANWKFEAPLNAGEPTRIEYLQTFTFVFD